MVEFSDPTQYQVLDPAPVGSARALQLTTVLVRRRGQDEHAASAGPRGLEERSERVDPEVGTRGHRVDREWRAVAQPRLGVALVGGREIAALRVRHYQQVGVVGLGDQSFEHAEPGRTEAVSYTHLEGEVDVEHRYERQ